MEKPTKIYDARIESGPAALYTPNRIYIYVIARLLNQPQVQHTVPPDFDEKPLLIKVDITYEPVTPRINECVQVGYYASCATWYIEGAKNNELYT